MQPIFKVNITAKAVDLTKVITEIPLKESECVLTAKIVQRYCDRLNFGKNIFKPVKIEKIKVIGYSNID